MRIEIAQRRVTQRVLAATIVLFVAGLCTSCLSPKLQHPSVTSHPATTATATAPLVLVSLDGFRWDFDRLTDTPNLDRLTRRGVRAERLIPTFPSKTFPTHYSIVTGLRAEHHGIVANTMFDPQRERWFSLGDRAAVGDSAWWGGEPLWATAERQGRRAGVMFWPGSEAEIAGFRPSFWSLYDHDLPAAERIARVSSWLALPEAERPAFIALYFPDADSPAHTYGPTSPELASVVAQLDHTIGMLLDALEPLGGLDAINLVILADHGMAPLVPDQVILLDQLVAEWDNRWVVDWGPVLALRPPPDQVEELYQALVGAHPHLQLWRREEVPARFHYRNNPRITPIVGLADEGWTIATTAFMKANPQASSGGNHGFDPGLESMGAIFIAAGPAFRQGVTVEPFESVHLYELFCEILDLAPASNDGERGRLAKLMVR